MIHVISRHERQLSPALRDDLGRYRHAVFVEQLGWQLPVGGGRPGYESDQFDHPGTRYTLALDGAQRIHGCARLLPTTEPYLLSEVFGFLCDRPLPRQDDTWEISRFAASALEGGTLPMRVFWHTLHTAWSLGANSVVAVTTPALERYFLRHGVALSRLGQPQRVERDWLLALDFAAFQKNGRAALHAQSAAVALPERAILGSSPSSGGDGLAMGQMLSE
ncbi:acyl-homoserine-lactone synthase [Pseudomonas chlororaphis]|uniref:Acyl-homoserine-lactone synthase n=1 Tax=Pseudomonas chlororaphis TaxID=587753 RepID=A0A0D5Y119_9PSED|nr:acyl-homoserine-lactone synthase [Pseudomonas chlororaphis]AKA25011.1 acyl-homoserine-lactone synthase [Pseudomonas chlororaphis]